MRERRKLSRMARIIAAAVLAVIAAAGPAEAVCELLASSAAGMTGLRIGTAIGARMGIAAGGTAIAGTWPVGLTLGILLATGTGVVLLASNASGLPRPGIGGRRDHGRRGRPGGRGNGGRCGHRRADERERVRARGDRPSSRQARSGVASRSHMGGATVQRRNAGGRRSGDESGTVRRTAGAGRPDRRGAGMDPRVPTGIQPTGGLRDVPRSRGNRRTLLTERWTGVRRQGRHRDKVGPGRAGTTRGRQRRPAATFAPRGHRDRHRAISCTTTLR